MKKIISLLLVALISIGAFPFALAQLVLAANAAELDFSYGDDCTWYYDTNSSIFYISGTGSTYDFGNLSQPWHEIMNTFPTASIGEGITRLGVNSLQSGFLYNVYLPSTLEIIDCEIPNNVQNIIIPENNSLKYVNTSTILNTKWFKSQPEGSVYLGNVFIGYKGDITSETVIDIKDGTKAVARDALYNKTNLENILFPETIEYLGERSLENTAWLTSQPNGPLYIGKAFYCYVGNVLIEDYIFSIREGTSSVCPRAMYSKSIVKHISIPSSVEYIGDYAFGYISSLNEVSFDYNSDLRYLGSYAFSNTKIGEFDLPAKLERIGNHTFGGILQTVIKIPASVNYIGSLYMTLTSNGDTNAKFIVSEENTKYSSDEYGCLFNNDKSVLIRAGIGFDLIEYYVPDTVIEIAPGAFRLLRAAYSTIHIPESVKKIGVEAFSRITYDTSNPEFTVDFGLSEPEISGSAFKYDKYLKGIIVRSMNLTFPESVFADVTDENFTVHLMRGSAMQTYCDTYDINYEFLDYELHLGEINDSLSIVETLDRTLYTEESLAALNEVVSLVDLDLKNLTQEQVDEWTSAINNALSSLIYLPADYTALSEALANARAVNRSLYTADSLLALDTLVLSIDYNANITQQAIVDKTASDIIDAINALQYRGADYSAVNTAISRALSVNRSMYTESSVSNLEVALQNVVYGLDITQQNRVNAYADSIELAITALVPKAADYTDVENAIKRANAVNRELYTETSLSALDNAINAIDYTLNYDNQHIVAEYAQAINNAIDSLVYLPADYSSVDRAITRANAIDRIMWSDSSLTALDQSISSINRGLNITQQPTVDAYATNIVNKLNSLEYANVVLRNEPNGVIISATSKEIYPTTSLSVDKLDPSDITNANFAVGGKVKTALYYDISLYRNSVKTQPNGTVVVKIKIPEGVEPGKCKVYHVTDDPVDPLVKFTSTLDGNYIVFETDHFSEFAVLEIETVLEGIVISSPPAKIIYTQGEAFSREGMIITAFFSDGRSAVIDDYDISVDTNTVGTRPLNVYYTFNDVTKSVSTVITVNKDGSIVSSEVVLHIPKDTSVEYRTKVTIVVSADNLPNDCSIVVSSGGTTVTKGTDAINYYVGEIDSSKTFLVRVVDKSGNTITDSSGKPVKAEFSIKVNNSFFARIIAFFKSLFKLLPEKEIKP